MRFMVTINIKQLKALHRILKDKENCSRETPVLSYFTRITVVKPKFDPSKPVPTYIVTIVIDEMYQDEQGNLIPTPRRHINKILDAINIFPEEENAPSKDTSHE